MELFYRKYGEAGPPLIILHGLYGASDNWISIARELGEDFEVYVPDQRNHGESPHDDLHTYEAMRQDLADFMDSLGIEKASLIGHSMGGKTAMYFATAFPERVETLVVLDIAPVSYHDLATESKMTANHAKMIDAMLELDLSKMESRQDVSKALAVKIGSERIRMFLLKNLTRNSNKEFVWKINLPALRENLEKIMDVIPQDDVIQRGGMKGFPAYFIKGANSDYVRPENHDIIRKIFPMAEIIPIPNAGHWLHAEQPELLMKNLDYILR